MEPLGVVSIETPIFNAVYSEFNLNLRVRWNKNRKNDRSPTTRGLRTSNPGRLTRIVHEKATRQH